MISFNNYAYDLFICKYIKVVLFATRILFLFPKICQVTNWQYIKRMFNCGLCYVVVPSSKYV